MAIALALNDLIEVKLFCTAPTVNQVSVNILRYLITAVTGASVTDVEAVDALSLTFSGDVKALLNNNANYFGMTLCRLKPLPRTTVTTSTSGNGAGTRSGDLAPAQLSAVLTKRTGKAGRRFRGRFYVPFPSQSDIETTSLPKAIYTADADTLGANIALVQVIIGGGGTASMTPIVYSPITPDLTPITNCTGALKFGTQRRRGEFGRTNLIPPF